MVSQGHEITEGIKALESAGGLTEKEKKDKGIALMGILSSLDVKAREKAKEKKAIELLCRGGLGDKLRRKSSFGDKRPDQSGRGDSSITPFPNEGRGDDL